MTRLFKKSSAEHSFHICRHDKLLVSSTIGVCCTRNEYFLYFEMDKNVIEKAGGIVISNSKPIRLVMLFRVENDDWSFPKGHVESGETFEAAALREVEEETGLKGTIISKLPVLEYTHVSEKCVNVHMYAMKCTQKNNFKPEHKRDKVVWVPLAEVSKKLTYENLSSYFSKIEPVIRKLSAESDF